MNTTTQKNPTVILVEDEENLRDSFCLFLTRYNVTPHSFPSVEDAEEYLKSSHEPFILITDHDLPGRTGIEFLSSLLRERPSQLSGVIMMSGREDLEHRLSAFAPQLQEKQIPYGSFVKPFSLKALAAFIEKLIAHFAATQTDSQKVPYLSRRSEILRNARNTLGLSIEAVVLELNKTGQAINFIQYTELESSDRLCDETAVTLWIKLCDILGLFAETDSYKYDITAHLKRVSALIDAQEFRFPITKTLENFLSDLASRPRITSSKDC